MLSARPSTFSGSMSISIFARKHKVRSVSAGSRSTSTCSGRTLAITTLATWSFRVHTRGRIIHHNSWVPSRIRSHSQDVGVTASLYGPPTPRISRTSDLTLERRVTSTLKVHQAVHWSDEAHPESGRILERQQDVALSAAGAHVQGYGSNHRRRISRGAMEIRNLRQVCRCAGRSGYQIAYAQRLNAQLDVARSSSKAHRKRLAYPLLPCRMHRPDPHFSLTNVFNNRHQDTAALTTQPPYLRTIAHGCLLLVWRIWTSRIRSAVTGTRFG